MFRRLFLSTSSKNLYFPILVKAIASTLQVQLKMHPNPRTPERSTSSPSKKTDFSAQLANLSRQSAMQRYLGEDSSAVPIANTLYGKYQAGNQGDIVHEPRCARGIEMGSTCKVPPQASGMPRFEAQSPSDGRFLATICPDHQLKPTKQAKSMSPSANDRSSSTRTEYGQTRSSSTAVAATRFSPAGLSKQQSHRDSTS